MIDPVTGTPADGIALVQGDAMRTLHTGDLFAGDPISVPVELAGSYNTLQADLQGTDWWGSRAAAEAAALSYGFTDDGVVEYFAFGTLALNSGTRVQVVFVKSDGTLGSTNLQAGASGTFVVEQEQQVFDYPWLNSDAQVGLLG